MRSVVTIWGSVLAACALIFPVFAAAESQCPLIDCDCDSLMEADWQARCQQRQSRLQTSCEANQGKLTGFCYVSGPSAYPVALSVKPSSQPLARGSEKELRERIKNLQWSATDDNQVALNSQQQGKLRQALLLRKREHKTRKQIYQTQLALGALWTTENDIDELVDYWLEASENKLAQVEAMVMSATKLWLDAENIDDKKRSVLQQRLAARMMSNAGALLEQTAYAFSMAGKPQEAVNQWQQAAQKAEQLVEWQQSVKAKASHIHFYQQQAAARWFRAALTASKAELAADAQMAQEQALRVLGVDAKQVAGG
ncbi:hypothetical protein R50073_15390 [Maricurvus nonylphenolicus]|uniref:hypothetical protein n=1 Tax=Maricurvus nonylphenolicus TaxID=1008307 RepID=UPI0036F3FB13